MSCENVKFVILYILDDMQGGCIYYFKKDSALKLIINTIRLYVGKLQLNF